MTTYAELMEALKKPFPKISGDMWRYALTIAENVIRLEAANSGIRTEAALSGFVGFLTGRLIEEIEDEEPKGPK